MLVLLLIVRAHRAHDLTVRSNLAAGHTAVRLVPGLGGIALNGHYSVGCHTLHDARVVRSCATGEAVNHHVPSIICR